MSTVTQQIEHARRAIAYALWNAELDGRSPQDLFIDQKWISEITGKFLAVEITQGNLPAQQINIVEPSRPSGSTYLRQMIDEGAAS